MAATSRQSTESAAPAETPRSRESFDDFTRRLGGIDAMEGPSWLYSSETTAERVAKPRDHSRREKAQANTLKARLSGASKRLSMTGQRDSLAPAHSGLNRKKKIKTKSQFFLLQLF
jgi:hypothetical protein